MMMIHVAVPGEEPEIDGRPVAKPDGGQGADVAGPGRYDGAAVGGDSHAALVVGAVGQEVEPSRRVHR